MKQRPRYGHLALLLAIAAAAALVTFWLNSTPRERGLALNTVYLAAGTCAISLPLGTLLALLVARTDLPGRRVFGVLLAVMLFMPLYVQTSAWQAGFGQQGWYSLAFSQLTEAPLLDRWRGAIWIHAVAAVPWVALIVGAGLLWVEPELEETALLDGTQWQVLCRITLRRAFPSLVAAALWVVVITSGEITVTDMWRLRTYAEEVFIGFALGESLEEVTLGVLPGTLLTAALAVAALVVFATFMPLHARPAVRARWTFRLGGWKGPAFCVVTLILLCLMGVPLANLLAKLGIVVQQVGDGRVRSWSGSFAVETLLSSAWEFRREVVWSLGTGGFAATIALLIGVPLVWLARHSGWAATVVILAAAMLLAVPGPILGLGLASLLNRPGWLLLNFLYDRTVLGPAIALVLRCLPLVILVLWHALRSVPQATLEVAALEGAGTWRQLWWIALPQRRPAVAAAWLVGLAVAVGDLSACFLVLPPGATPLSVRIFGLAHYGVENLLAGITLLATFMMTAIALASLWFLQRQKTTSSKQRSL